MPHEREEIGSSEGPSGNAPDDGRSVSGIIDRQAEQKWRTGLIAGVILLMACDIDGANTMRGDVLAFLGGMSQHSRSINGKDCLRRTKRSSLRREFRVMSAIVALHVERAGQKVSQGVDP